MTTPNDSDAERELQRVEEIERNKMQDRTKAIVEAAEALCEHVKIGLDVKVGEVPRITYTHTLDDLRRLSEAVALPAEPAPSSDRSTVERLDTLRQLVDLTHKNAARSLQETARCVTESLAEIRDALASVPTAHPPSAPQWTRTPPSEPGHFWIRYVGKFSDVHQHLAGVHLVEVAMREPRAFASGRVVPTVAMVYPLQGPGGEGSGWLLSDSERHGVEWWPVRIEEPPA